MAVYNADCPHCSVSRVGFTIHWSYGVSRYERVAIGSCGGCHLPISILLQGPDGPVENLAGEISEKYVTLDIWPRIANLSAPLHTPPNVERRFIEGEDAFRRERWNSAVAMYRSALDIATKGLADVPKGLTFYNRLIWLHDNHIITQQMKDWADHVRIEGNEALHDPDDFEETDAAPLRLFTETFLRYIYELPGEVAKFREETPPH